MPRGPSLKARQFTESVIREMTREARAHGAVNLAQGFPDFGAPEVLKEAAVAALGAEINQYAITWGAKGFRDAIAGKARRDLGLDVDPETEITVTCGATEAMIASMLALVDPGDEVVIFEPFYENYGPDVVLSGAVPRFVRLRPPDWHFDTEELERAFGPRTRAVVLNTPNNPTGKVFTRAELEAIAALCVKWDTLVFTDEIYEHILYDGAEHVAMATLPGMRERTVTINSLSKTYSVTGWRVGYIVANKMLIDNVTKLNQITFNNVPIFIQDAALKGLELHAKIASSIKAKYKERADLATKKLSAGGFKFTKPDAPFYMFPKRDGLDGEKFTLSLLDKGVAVAPGTSFGDYREHFRISLTAPDDQIVEGLEKICEAVNR